MVMNEDSSKNNVIPFPNLEKHLLNKAKDCLRYGNTKDAIRFLQESKLMDEGNPETLRLLTTAYMQQGNFHQAKQLLEEMMEQGIGDYFEITDLYISVLFELHEYKKIKTMLTMLLEEGQISEK